MNLPKSWSVLKLDKDTNHKYLFGVDYSTSSYHYSVYITDLTNVWICDADEQKLQLKAFQNGISLESLQSVYQTLIVSFENNFNGEDTETLLELERLQIDRGTPLELRLNLTKVYDSAKLKWNFDLTVLPDSNAISILRHLIFHLSTVIFSMNEYKNDLVRQIEHKDSAIRYLSESMQGMDASHIIKKWAPENSTNSRILKEFDPQAFDKVWKEKKLVHLENQYIWDVIDLNKETWSFGTFFRQQNTTQKAIKDKKRSISDDFDQSGTGAENEDEIRRSQSPVKKRRTENLEELTTDFKEYDLKRDSQEESKQNSNHSSRSPSISSSPRKESDKDNESESRDQSQSQSQSQTPTPTEQSQSPDSKGQTKKKRGFGVSRKRRIAYSSFSPIKSAKHFQSDD